MPWGENITEKFDLDRSAYPVVCALCADMRIPPDKIRLRMSKRLSVSRRLSMSVRKVARLSADIPDKATISGRRREWLKKEEAK